MKQFIPLLLFLIMALALTEPDIIRALSNNFGFLVIYLFGILFIGWCAVVALFVRP